MVLTFLPRSKCLLISWLQSPSAVIFEPPKIKSATVSIVSPSICHEAMGSQTVRHDWVTELNWTEQNGTRCHDLSFLNVEFKPAFSLSSFTFIKKLFSSSSLSAIRMVSFAYLRLLTFLLAILIPACASSSLAFHMMYCAYKLNKQGDNIQYSYTWQLM